MARNFSIINLKDEINCCLPNLGGLKIFLFGSALHGTQKPHDLDFLIVYNEKKISRLLLKDLKRNIGNSVWRNFGLMADFCTLNLAESRSSCFISQEKAVRLCQSRKIPGASGTRKAKVRGAVPRGG
jgi:predicted nucleotidyltransferase